LQRKSRAPDWPRSRKLKCSSRNRYHHLLKTFYTGPNGWRDRQEPDGTLVWTSPTGHEYITKPAGSLYFPALAIPTGTLTPPTDMPPPERNRGLMMPLRRRTRAEDRVARISRERRVNEACLAEERRQYERGSPPLTNPHRSDRG
jgi:hypothetical protein